MAELRYCLRARTIRVCSQKPMHCAGEPKVGESARGKMAHKRNIVDNFKAKSIHSAAALRSERTAITESLDYAKC